MEVKRLHRPDESYTQCQFPKEELSEDSWNGYREKRAKFSGKDVKTCMRGAQWRIDGTPLCTQHAGIRVLEHLEVKGDD